jgi:hypothetical protein
MDDIKLYASKKNHILFLLTVMNQVGNSKFPPIGHLIFFFLPTYTMKNKTREIQKNWPRARDRT